MAKEEKKETGKAAVVAGFGKGVTKSEQVHLSGRTSTDVQSTGLKPGPTFNHQAS